MDHLRLSHREDDSALAASGAFCGAPGSGPFDPRLSIPLMGCPGRRPRGGSTWDIPEPVAMSQCQCEDHSEPTTLSPATDAAHYSPTSGSCGYCQWKTINGHRTQV